MSYRIKAGSVCHSKFDKLSAVKNRVANQLYQKALLDRIDAAKKNKVSLKKIFDIKQTLEILTLLGSHKNVWDILKRKQKWNMRKVTQGKNYQYPMKSYG